MHRLETACRYQVDGSCGQRGLNYLSEDVQKRTKEQGYATLGPNRFARSGFEWPGLLPKLERERGGSYKT